MATKRTILAFTGPPAVGKSTLCMKIVEGLKNHNKQVYGFITQEVRGSDGYRLGLDVIDLYDPCQRGILARIGGDGPKVGKYAVDIPSFTSIALPALSSFQAAVSDATSLSSSSPSSSSPYLIIDEIGKMESFSSEFLAVFMSLLHQQQITSTAATARIILTVAQKGDGLIAEIKNHPDVELIEMSKGNRDDVTQMIIDRLVSE